MSLRLAWSTKGVPGQPRLHRETLSLEKKQNKTKKQKWNLLVVRRAYFKKK